MAAAPPVHASRRARAIDASSAAAVQLGVMGSIGFDAWTYGREIG